MIPEVLPLSVRGTAMGVAVFANWAANFAVSQTFPVLLSAVGAGAVFLGYAVLGMLAGVFVKVFVTETKGRSLEEIEADLQSATGMRESGAASRHHERQRSRGSVAMPGSASSRTPQTRRSTPDR